MVVPCYEIPTTSRRDKAVRLDEPSAALAITSPVVETHVLVVRVLSPSGICVSEEPRTVRRWSGVWVLMKQ